MSIYRMAQELGKAIKEDERMIRMAAAKEAYESDREIERLMSEYKMQQHTLTMMGDSDQIDTDLITRIQDRIDEIYSQITNHPLFIELNDAQAVANELMKNINGTIMYNITGEMPGCSGDGCSSCSGCQ